MKATGYIIHRISWNRDMIRSASTYMCAIHPFWIYDIISMVLRDVSLLPWHDGESWLIGQSLLHLIPPFPRHQKVMSYQVTTHRIALVPLIHWLTVRYKAIYIYMYPSILKVLCIHYIHIYISWYASPLHLVFCGKNIPAWSLCIRCIPIIIHHSSFPKKRSLSPFNACY